MRDGTTYKGYKMEGANIKSLLEKTEMLKERIDELIEALDNQIDCNNKLEAQNERLRSLLDPTEKE
jgi:regulator of replication initiation timing